jgi:hypothetical protein
MAFLSRREWAAAVLGLVAASAATAQDTGSTFRTVDPIGIPNDKPDVWTLNFGYYPPRIITVDTGKGKRRVWYMVFSVWNKTGNPQQIVPEFELVAKDPDLAGSFLDEPRPTALKQIREIEDKTKALDLKSTIEITRTKIPVTKPDSYPNAVNGVAVWEDVPDKIGKVNRFSIYVGGLSNGIYEEPAADGTIVVKRKTLQLDFFKPTDDRNPKLDDIRVDDNKGLGGENWVYRASSTKKAAAKPKDDGK